MQCAFGGMQSAFGDMSGRIETYNNEFKVQNTEGALRLQEIQFINGETIIRKNAKLF